MNYSKQLIKTLYRVNKSEAEIAYRFYLIAQKHYYRRSGIFSVSEFMDVLTGYGFKTLHKLPGNNRTRFRRKLTTLFDNSILFEKRPDGRYKYIPERKILKKTYSSKFPVLEADLMSRRAFTDALIGVVVAGNQLKSYKRTADQLGYTAGRIRQACSRNHKAQRIIKQNNYILADTEPGSYEDILRLRKMLMYGHGIFTPEPLKYKGQFLLVLYGANTYSSTVFVDQGYKGRGHLPLYVKKDSCHFKPADPRMQRVFGTDAQLWFFNSQKYDLERYVEDNRSQYL